MKIIEIEVPVYHGYRSERKKQPFIFFFVFFLVNIFLFFLLSFRVLWRIRMVYESSSYKVSRSNRSQAHITSKTLSYSLFSLFILVFVFCFIICWSWSLWFSLSVFHFFLVWLTGRLIRLIGSIRFDLDPLASRPSFLVLYSLFLRIHMLAYQ